MTKTVSNALHTIGDRSGDLARTVGSGTADLARRVGSGTTSLARQIGPRRALIGLAVLGVAIGGTVVLLRYLRNRNASEDLETAGDGNSRDRSMSRKRSRAEHRAETAASH